MLMEGDAEPEATIYGLRRNDSDDTHLVEHQVKQAKIDSIKVDRGRRASIISTQSNGTQKLTEGNETSIRGSFQVS